MTQITQQNLLAEILPTPSHEIKTDRFIQAISSSANARCVGSCSSGGCKSAV